MDEQAKMKRRIYELDFAIHELVLFLDSHTQNTKAMDLLRRFRELRSQAVAEYERQFGNYVVTADDVIPEGSWSWIDGPWPWEINFMED